MVWTVPKLKCCVYTTALHQQWAGKEGILLDSTAWTVVKAVSRTRTWGSGSD